jgi:hypothetical protein
MGAANPAAIRSLRLAGTYALNEYRRFCLLEYRIAFDESGIQFKRSYHPRVFPIQILVGFALVSPGCNYGDAMLDGECFTIAVLEFGGKVSDKTVNLL